MITIQTTGLDETIARLKAKSSALRNLEPAYKRFAAEIVKKTDDSFQNSKGYDGEAWEPLAQSTIDGRVGSLKAANRKTKAGKLTKGAAKLQGALRAPGGIKPLIDTARARNSNHATTSRDGVEWNAVGYLGYHIGGSADGKLPKRNPSPFEWDGSKWVMRESAKRSLYAAIRNHVFGGSQ